MSAKILSNQFTLVTSCLILLAIPAPAKAFSVTLDTFTSTGNTLTSRVDDNVNFSATINTTSTPNGFGNFFAEQDDPFLLLGDASNQTISDDDLTVGVSLATSESIEISSENANQDLVLNFDWIFQGDSTGIAGINVDTFSVTLIGGGIDALGNPNVNTDLLVENQYGKNRGESLSLPRNLPIGTYNIQFSVIEPTVVDPNILIGTNLTNTEASFILANDNSAAGIDNLSVSSVPFEFTPTTGLLIVGSIWGLLRWQKRKNLVSNNEPKS